MLIIASLLIVLPSWTHSCLLMVMVSLAKNKFITSSFHSTQSLVYTLTINICFRLCEPSWLLTPFSLLPNGSSSLKKRMGSTSVVPFAESFMPRTSTEPRSKTSYPVVISTELGLRYEGWWMVVVIGMAERTWSMSRLTSSRKSRSTKLRIVTKQLGPLLLPHPKGSDAFYTLDTCSCIITKIVLFS